MLVMSPTLLLSCATFTASVSAVPAATLVIWRSAPAEPTETVLARSATELAPRATEFFSLALEPLPIATEFSPAALALVPTAMLLLPLAVDPAPPATASVPVAFGFGSLLVLFTWNMPSVPLLILVTRLSISPTRLSILVTLPLTSLSWATFTASVSSLPAFTLVI
ncbi:hypothetical protein FQZ97_949860 [compost metagenome]